MSKIMADDSMVTGYKMSGDKLILDINNDRPNTDYTSYGFNDDYKLSLIKSTGVKSVEFNPKIKI